MTSITNVAQTCLLLTRVVFANRPDLSQVKRKDRAQRTLAFEFFNAQTATQSLPTLHATIKQLSSVGHVPRQVICQAMQMMADRCKLTPTTLRRLLKHSNLDADALICVGQSPSELVVDTMAVSDADLERLYDTLYKESEVSRCNWVQCDLCSKWRRLHGSHTILEDEPWQCDMIDGLDCTHPEELMEDDEVWL